MQRILENKRSTHSPIKGTEKSFPSLLLFDIDGTLIRSAGLGRTAMNMAFVQMYGISDGLDGIEMMGRTDPSILKEALEKHGLAYGPDADRAFQNVYYPILEDVINWPRPEKHVCPGIQTLLDILENRSDAVLGLLTGNWKKSAYTKLRHFKIDRYFKFGAFADDSPFREQLVPFARQRFESSQNRSLPPERITVIGDTPLDILCARPHGVRTVAVATGFHTVEQLQAEKPDAVFRDFSDTAVALDSLLPDSPDDGNRRKIVS